MEDVAVRGRSVTWARRALIRRLRAQSGAVLGTTLVLGGGIAGTVAGYFLEGRETVPELLDGRIGGPAAGWEHRIGRELVPTRASGDFGETRLAWMVTPERIVADVLPNGRVRQVSIGRERLVAQATDPMSGDWTLPEAQHVARSWLPADAVVSITEPFIVGDRVAGPRERYVSRALARFLTLSEYQQARAEGPPGQCLAQYYLTDDDRVAFLLMGLG